MIVMEKTEIDEFPAIKAAVNSGICAGFHLLSNEGGAPTYEKAQDYVIDEIIKELNRLRQR